MSQAPKRLDAAAAAPIAVELAGVRRRLASMLYESLLLLGVLSLTFVVPNVAAGVMWHVTSPGWLAWLNVTVVLGAYFLWSWLRGGQTLAMQTWRLKLVVAESGRSVDWRRGLLRYLLAWPSVCLFGAGLVWAFFDRDRQFLHDRLAGTRIVLLPPHSKD